jgi:integrase/recombinase XerD
MNPLREALADYLSLRRSLGYGLRRPEKLLNQFLDYLQQRGASTITTDLAAAWARLPQHGSPLWWAHRLTVVRGFAGYLHVLDEAHDVPPTDVLPWKSHRASPYLYTNAEIAALIAAAATLRFPLRVATYQTLVALLAVTGMRVGEAIDLDGDDFDDDRGVLLVRQGKGGATRQLPLHPSTTAAVRGYLQRPDRRSAARTAALLISPAGTRLLYCNVHVTFQKLVRQAGIEPRSSSCRPRIHDYADLRVMPTSACKSLQTGVISVSGLA